MKALIIIYDKTNIKNEHDKTIGVHNLFPPKTSYNMISKTDFPLYTFKPIIFLVGMLQSTAIKINCNNILFDFFELISINQYENNYIKKIY